MAQFSTTIQTLGPAKIPSTLTHFTGSGKAAKIFVSDESRILAEVLVDQLDFNSTTPASFDQAGPRENIYFDPSRIQ